MSTLFIDTDMTGDFPVVKVKGRVDSETAPELETVLANFLKEEKCKLVLNLKEVDFLSSAGLRAIVRTHQDATKMGGNVHLAAVSEPIEVVLRTVGMMQFLKLFPTTEAAIASFQ